MAKEIFSITSISFLYSNSNSLKHTRKYGIQNPFDSPLLARIIEDLFVEKMAQRIGEGIPTKQISNGLKTGIYLEFNSQTSDGIYEGYKYRELGANLFPNGTCTVVHLYEHDDENKFTKKNCEIEIRPFFYIIDSKLNLNKN